MLLFLNPEPLNTPPQKPKPAATLILVRQRDAELQYYLLRRRGGNGFMAGLYVFPGGVVDAADKDTAFWWPHIDVSPAEADKRLGGTAISPDGVLPYAVAAIRETFEEAGVLMARPMGQVRFSSTYLNDLRDKSAHGRDHLNGEAARNRIRLSVGALQRWSHWITPKQMSRCFDTRFFWAEMPCGQNCSPDRQETTTGRWITARQAIAANLRGEVPLSPPTIVTLQQLRDVPDVESLQKKTQDRNWGAPIEPRQVSFKTGAMVLEPWDPDHETGKVDVDPDRLEQKVLPAGAPFSRVWFNGKHWRPVGL